MPVNEFYTFKRKNWIEREKNALAECWQLKSFDAFRSSIWIQWKRPLAYSPYINRMLYAITIFTSYLHYGICVWAEYGRSWSKKTHFKNELCLGRKTFISVCSQTLLLLLFLFLFPGFYFYNFINTSQTREHWKNVSNREWHEEERWSHQTYREWHLVANAWLSLVTYLYFLRLWSMCNGNSFFALVLFFYLYRSLCILSWPLLWLRSLAFN